MRKSVVYLLSAGMLFTFSCGNLQAKAKEVKQTVATQMFGGDISKVISATKDINSGATNAKKSINSATTKLENLSMNTKTFDTNTEVSTPLVISANLEFCASVLEKISRSLVIQNQGFTSVNKAKNDGDAKAQDGRKLLRQSVKTMAAVEPLLASVRANIAILGKFCKGKTQKVNNPGEAEKALKSLITDIKDKKKTFGGTKKGLVSLVNEYQDNFDSIAETTTDPELQGWLKKGSSYVANFREVIEIFDQLLEASDNYLLNGSLEALFSLAEECESSVSNVKVEVNRQSSQRKELKNLAKKGTVKKSNTKNLSNKFQDQAVELKRQKDQKKELNNLKGKVDVKSKKQQLAAAMIGQNGKSVENDESDDDKFAQQLQDEDEDEEGEDEDSEE